MYLKMVCAQGFVIGAIMTNVQAHYLFLHSKQKDTFLGFMHYINTVSVLRF